MPESEKDRLARIERLQAVVVPKLREIKRLADAKRDHPAFFKSEGGKK